MYTCLKHRPIDSISEQLLPEASDCPHYPHIFHYIHISLHPLHYNTLQNPNMLPFIISAWSQLPIHQSYIRHFIHFGALGHPQCCDVMLKLDLLRRAVKISSDQVMSCPCPAFLLSSSTTSTFFFYLFSSTSTSHNYSLNKAN